MKYPIVIVSILTFLTFQRALCQVSEIPERATGNLVVAVYNIQFFGASHHDLGKLAKVIQNFDVCGILEVKRESAIPGLVEELETQTGQDWGYTFGIRTHRPGGSYHEAYGVVWRKDRVDLGDGIIGGIWDLEEAYRNDPYIVSFKCKKFDFILALLHTRWSDDVEGTRASEVAMIPETRTLDEIIHRRTRCAHSRRLQLSRLELCDEGNGRGSKPCAIGQRSQINIQEGWYWIREFI